MQETDEETWARERMFFYLPSKLEKAIKTVTKDIIDDVPLKDYQYPVLRIVQHNDGITQKRINAEVPFDKSRISVIVHELMDMGMIEDTGEGRTSSLHITQKGIEAVDAARGFTSAAFSRIMNVFSEDELQEVGAFFRKLDAHLDEINSRS